MHSQSQSLSDRPVVDYLNNIPRSTLTTDYWTELESQRQSSQQWTTNQWDSCMGGKRGENSSSTRVSGLFTGDFSRSLNLIRSLLFHAREFPELWFLLWKFLPWFPLSLRLSFNCSVRRWRALASFSCYQIAFLPLHFVRLHEMQCTVMLPVD